MITKTAIINLRTGLDLRAAGIMCQKATAYKSHIELRTGDIAVNAKSVLSVMSVGFEKVYLMQNPINLDVSEIISTFVYKRGIYVVSFERGNG